MSVPNIVVECDLDDDGIYETDISSYVEVLGRLEFGRTNILERHRPRRLDGMLLDNEDSRFSPDNASSPYNTGGKTWGQDKHIQIKLRVPTAAISVLNDNPSFENDITGASAVAACSVTQETAKARYGKSCLRITATADSPDVDAKIVMRDASRIPVSASTAYVVSLAHRAVAGDVFLFRIRVDWYDSVPSLISSSTSDNIAGREHWGDRGVFTATSPVGAVTAEIHIIEAAIFGGWTSGEIMYVDGVNLYAGAAELPYCDGDQPGASWAGTAHESTSSRPANPTFTKITGRISALECVRGRDNRCRVRIVSEMDYWLDQHIWLGNVVKRDGDIVLKVILDRLEKNEIMLSRGAQTPDYPALTDFTVIGPTSGSGDVVDLVGIADNEKVEGDKTRAYQNEMPPTTGDGWELDLSSKCGADEAWHYTLWLVGRSGDDHAGKQVRFKMADSGGIKAQEVADVPTVAAGPTYVVLNGTWTAEGTARKLQLVCDEAWGSGNAFPFLWDILHAVPREDEISFDFRFGSGQTAYAELEHVASFNAAARPLLEKVVNSIGGVAWEAGDGDYTVEDYKTRVDSPIPVARFTDSGEGDGVGIPPTGAGRRQDRTYTRVTVWSDGDISAVADDPTSLWSMEPANLTLSASEERYLYARYLSDEEGPLIGDRLLLRKSLSAGSLAAEEVENWGFGAVIRLTAGGSGATIAALHLTQGSGSHSGIRQRSSHRSKVTKGDDTGRELEIEMSMQGDKTTPMDDVATQMQSLLSAGRTALALPLDAVTVEEWLCVCGLEVGDPVWVRHNTGPGHFGLDEAYYMEGGTLSFRAGGAPRLTINLEKAA